MNQIEEYSPEQFYEERLKTVNSNLAIHQSTAAKLQVEKDALETILRIFSNPEPIPLVRVKPEALVARKEVISNGNKPDIAIRKQEILNWMQEVKRDVTFTEIATAVMESPISDFRKTYKEVDANMKFMLRYTLTDLVNEGKVIKTGTGKFDIKYSLPQ